MNWDLSKYLALFVSESREHLDALSAGLVRLERSGGAGEDPAAGVDELFRHAHSLKGMAAAMQQEGIALIAHRAEDVIGVLRARGEAPSADVVDLLLAVTDALSEMVQEAGAGGAPVAPEALAERLSGVSSRVRGVEAPVEAPPTPALEPSPAAAAPPSEASPARGRTRRMRVEVEVAEGSQVPAVRGFLVLKRLEGAGRIVSSTPAGEELRAGRMPGRTLSVELDAAPPAPRPEGGGEPARTVRVRAEMLDEFLDVSGELLLATARLRELGRAMPEAGRRAHEEGVDRLQAIAKDLHGRVMSARMTPLTALSDRLPRAARDLARRTGKQVDVVVTGSEIEVDRALLDEISDPILHLLRNAVDHGIETAAQRIAAGKRPTGRIEVSARRDRDRVILEVADDGRGMDPDALRRSAVARGAIGAEAAAALPDPEAFLLACLPGVSTAGQVTDVSGRGVGMDAVKRSVEALSGKLSIESRRGEGTRFTLRLPLTVAMQPVLLVRVGQEVVAIPVSKVFGAAQARVEALDRAGGAPQLSFGGGHVPVLDLGVLLGMGAAATGTRRSVVITESDAGRVGLAVDQLLGQEDAVLKPLHGPLSLVPGLSAVTVLGNGRPVFVLDVPRLVAA
ncbi:MAG: CheA signal transduction histidine kinase [Anaeromyxobacteraceae bacterium]|nr:CheA signal transduction histidine kinase [Anaeromyxobacteraceae bacterium]